LEVLVQVLPPNALPDANPTFVDSYDKHHANKQGRIPGVYSPVFALSQLAGHGILGVIVINK
jgi:hypothetical protein